MKLLLLVAAANYLNIFLRAFQQRNVAFDKYKLVPITSLAMATTEVTVIGVVATSGFSIPLVLAMALGGASGAITAMYVHKKVA